MQEQAPESRQGHAWSEAEDAQLVSGVRHGLTLRQLAERHGRTEGALRARLERFVAHPGQVDDDALEWLRAQLDADPDYPRQSVLHNHRHRERNGQDHHISTSDVRAGAVAIGEVLADWQQATGHVLAPERREGFLARQVVGDLGAVPAAVRQATAQRLWHDEARLLLDNWMLECLCPGAVGLTGNWAPIAEGDADTVLVLHELIAVAVGEIPDERNRKIMEHRLGLHDQPAQSLEMVGASVGLSRERVRQLQTKAIRSMRNTRAPASRKLRKLLADLSCMEGTPPAEGPSTAERLLDLAEVVVPSLMPRQAVPLLAALAGSNKARADDLAAEAMTIRGLRHNAARREAARQGRNERATRRWQALSADITWFGTPEPPPPREELEALRETNSNEGHSGSWYCPKLEREVAYESVTELRMIQMLSFASQIVYYQEQPLAIGYRFDGRQRTYYPDLLAATTDGRCVLIEAKPLYDMATAINIAKYRAMEQFCRALGWGLVTTDGNRSRGLLEQRSVDPRLEALLSAALQQHGELTWPQARAAAGTLPLHWADIPALILRHGWAWHTKPYLLRAGKRGTGDGAVPEDAASVAQDRLPAHPVIGIPSPADIDAARTPAGGWRQEQLAAWGISWPPPKGWRKQLLNRWQAEQQKPPG